MALPLRTELRQMAREQIAHRELLWTIVRRDLTLRYRTTVIGIAWAVLNPLITLVIFTAIFTRVAPVTTTEPYPLYAYCGLLPWTMFASSVRFASRSLVDNASLVTKVFFPREVLPFSAVAASVIDGLIASTVLIALLVYYRAPVASTLLLVPIVLIVQVALTTGVALFVAMANLFYRDVKYLVEPSLTVWMFATSVLYPVDRVGGWLGRVLAVNPMTPIIDAYRALVLRQQLPPMGPSLYALTASLLIFVVAWLAFHRAEYRFAETL
jgi:lipopolysaccharide transport system permease protein